MRHLKPSKKFSWQNIVHITLPFYGDKSQLLKSGNKAIASTGNNCIDSEDLNELLGITTNSELTFGNHINKLCKKASQKLKAVLRICCYMTFEKKNNKSFHYIIV